MAISFSNALFTSDSLFVPVQTIFPFENKRTKIKFGVGSKWFGDFFNFNGEAEDIPALANEFLNKASKKKLPPNAVKNRSLKNKKPK